MALAGMKAVVLWVGAGIVGGVEAREAELSISVDLEGPCLRGHLPPMADYQELCRDLTPSTITLYGRDISNKIPISSKRGREGGRGVRDGKKRIFSFSLSSGSFRQWEAISFPPSCLVGFFFSLRLSSSLRSKSPLILELHKWGIYKTD